MASFEERRSSEAGRVLGARKEKWYYLRTTDATPTEAKPLDGLHLAFPPGEGVPNATGRGTVWVELVATSFNETDNLGVAHETRVAINVSYTTNASGVASYSNTVTAISAMARFPNVATSGTIAVTAAGDKLVITVTGVASKTITHNIRVRIVEAHLNSGI